MRWFLAALLSGFFMLFFGAVGSAQTVGVNITGNLSVTSGSLGGGAPQNAACSTKHNFDLGMVGASSTTQMIVVHLDSAILCLNSAWTTGPIAASGQSVRLANLQSFPGPQLIADITASGVSTSSTVGGLDTGSIAPDTDYCLWLVANDTTWGLVWSATCSTQGPQGGIQATYPYYAYLGWNRSNAGATGFQWQIQKIGTWSFFVGSAYPKVASAPCGAVTSWCNLGLYPGPVSPNAGEVQFMLSNNGTSGYVALAPTPQWSSVPACFLYNGAAADNFYVGCPVMITSGGFFGYAITSSAAGAGIYIAGFNDPR